MAGRLTSTAPSSLLRNQNVPTVSRDTTDPATGSIPSPCSLSKFTEHPPSSHRNRKITAENYSASNATIPTNTRPNERLSSSQSSNYHRRISDRPSARCEPSKEVLSNSAKGKLRTAFNSCRACCRKYKTRSRKSHNP